MSVKVVENYVFNIENSLLLEDDDKREVAIKLAGRCNSQLINGAVALSCDLKLYPLISEFIARQLSTQKLSFQSAVTYGVNLCYLVDYLKGQPAFKNSKLDECLLTVNETTLKQYFNSLRESGVSSVTVRNRDATYFSFFTKFLCQKIGCRPEIRIDNPYGSEKLLSPRPSTDIVEMATVQELEALISCSRYERERALLQFMFDSGLRRSEIPRVTKLHLDSARQVIQGAFIVDDFTILLPPNYCRVEVYGSKGRGQELKLRQSLVSRPTLNRVAKYHSTPLYKKHVRTMKRDKPAFLNAHGQPWKPKAITDLLSRLSKKAIRMGLISRAISPHKLRHGYAGITLRTNDLGKDAVERLVIVKTSLGHASLKTTEKYTSLPYETYGKIVDRSTGEILTRFQIMDHLYKKSKIRIGLKDEK